MRFIDLHDFLQHDENVSAAVLIFEKPELLFPTFVFDNLPNTSNLRLKHSVPFDHPFARSCYLHQPID